MARSLRSVLTSCVNVIVARRWFLAACLGGAIVGAALCLVIPGCGLQERTSTLEQQQREKVDQNSAAELSQSLKPAPFKIEIPQKDAEPIKIESPPAADTSAKQTNNESSDSKASGTSDQSETFPFFVKLIGVAVGLALIGGLIWLARRSSAAVNAAWNGADELIAAKLKTIGALRGATTDPAKAQAYGDAETALNDLRAEVLK